MADKYIPKILISVNYIYWFKRLTLNLMNQPIKIESC